MALRVGCPYCTSHVSQLLQAFASSNRVHLTAAEGEPEGHLFAGAPHPAGAASAKSFQRMVLREWRTLSANLPSSIWVRAYETRCARLAVP